MRWTLAILLAVTAAAAAQTPPPGVPASGDLTELSLEDLMQVEIPQVYAASQFDQKVTDAPAAVSIVTAEDIQRYGYRTLGEIIRSVRGFYTSYDRNYTYLGARGFSRPGDYNSRILLLLDGHRINDFVYDSTGLGTDGVINVALIDRVEIVRGPSSSLYGTEAFFGVVNVITQRGSAAAGARAAIEGGSWRTGAGSVSYGWFSPGRIDALVSGSIYRSNGQRLYYPQFDAPATNGGITDGSDGDRYRRVFARATFGDFTLEGVHASRTKTIPTGSFGTVFDDPQNQTTDESNFIDLLYGRSIGDRSRIDARVGADWYHYAGTYVYDQPPIVLNQDEARGYAAAAEFRYTTTAISKNVLVAGGDARFPYRQNQANFDQTPYYSYLSANHGSRDFAVYIQDEYRPVASWEFSGGLRFDHYETFGGTLNPRLAVIYKPGDNSAIKLLYGRAFRAPSAYELYYSDGFSTKQSTDLVPETIETYEAVYEYYNRNGFHVSASAFYYTIADLISLETDPADGLLVFRNVDRVQSEGVEVELAHRWHLGQEVRFSYSFQQSENATTNSTLTNSPRHLGKLNVSSPLVKDRLFLGVEIHYTSARQTLAGNEAHGFGLANLTLFTKDLGKGFDLSVSVYNLLDKNYADPGSEEHIQDTIEQDGRGWRLTLGYRY